MRGVKNEVVFEYPVRTNIGRQGGALHGRERQRAGERSEQQGHAEELRHGCLLVSRAGSDTADEMQLATAATFEPCARAVPLA